MKTAISIPDRIFKAADRAAKRLKISRSELYARAISAFLERQEDREVTQALDAIYAKESSTLDPVLKALQKASIPREEW